MDLGLIYRKRDRYRDIEGKRHRDWDNDIERQREKNRRDRHRDNDRKIKRDRERERERATEREIYSSDENEGKADDISVACKVDALII